MGNRILGKIKDFPTKLLDAQENGNLVIFAGSGISMGAPSNLPSFNGLVEDIAKVNNKEYNSKEPLEVFLGKLQQTNLKFQIQKLLGNPESIPKEIHKSIIKLYKQEDLKVVTTNADKHLTTAYHEFHEKYPKIYRAPALPLGDDFRGIVYLHGCVDDDDPDNLVFTDSDFGKAYLTQGWARRFLLRLFSTDSNYVTLFIGYSHSDRVMEFLSRGLPPNTGNRYALVIQPEKENEDDFEKWNYYGIDTIIFPRSENKDNEFEYLDLSIKKWAEECQFNEYEIHNQIRNIVESVNPTSENKHSEKLDFLKHSLKTVSQIRFFTHYCNDSNRWRNYLPNWLSWLEENELLIDLLDKKNITNEEKKEKLNLISEWLTENFIDKNYHIAFHLIEKYQYNINSILWFNIERKLWKKQKEIIPEIFSQWILILLKTYYPGCDTDILEYILVDCKIPEHKNVIILLLDFLIQPEIVYNNKSVERFNINSMNYDIKLKADKFKLEQCWENIISPNLTILAFDLIHLFSEKIKYADRMIRSTSHKNYFYDFLNDSRSAIEKHEQDEYNDSFYFILNALRDVTEFLIEKNCEIVKSLIDEWSNSNVTLLQRLAIYIVKINPKMNSNKKIQWLFKNYDLIQWDTRHELFQLFSVTYHKLNERYKKQILNIFNKKSKYKIFNHLDKSEIEYELFEISGFLLQYGDCPLLANIHNNLVKTHGWELREYPDLLSYHKSGYIRAESPIPDIDLTSKKSKEIVDLILEYNVKDKFRSHIRMGLQYEIKKFAQTSISKSINLIQELSNLDKKHDAISWIIWGWQEPDYEIEDWDKIFAFLEENNDFYYFAKDILNLFSYKKPPDTQIDRISKITFDIFRYCSENNDSIPKDDSDNWLYESSNHPGGSSIELLIRNMSYKINKEEKSSQEIINQYLDYFTQVVNTNSYTSQMGKISLCSQLAFLHYYNCEWTRSNLFPLFDFKSSEKQARQAWHGFLFMGRLNEILLNDFVEYYKKSFGYIKDDTEQMLDRWHEHIAFISLYHFDDPWSNGWLKDFIGCNDVNDRSRAGWAYHISQNLKDMKDQEKIHIWDTWLKTYWNNRNNNIPIELHNSEKKGMLHWCISLKPVFPDVVKTICRGNPLSDFDNAHSFFYYIDKVNIVQEHPKESAQLLLFIIKTLKKREFIEKELKKWILQLIESDIVNKSVLDDILDNAEMLGYFFDDLREKINA
jgi:hypothetical protein